MNILRRSCSVFILLTAPLALLGVRVKVTPSAAKSYRAYIGTYTTKTNSKGIYEFDFDPLTGKMSAVEVAGESKDPSWVALHPNGKYLYAANETGNSSSISAFAIEPKTGKLTLLKQVPDLGQDPCYLAFDRAGRFLLIANYTSGDIVALEISPDGTPGKRIESPNHGGSESAGTLGPNRERQEAPHAHWIQPSGDNHFVYVADLGLDRILTFQFNPDAWKSAKPVLSPMPNGQGFDRAAVLAPGTGPRHAVFSTSGRFLYVLGELKSTVTVFARDGEQFRSLEVLPMLPPGFSGRNDGAEIALHPSGKFLYASNRGHDSIVVFAVDEATGTLKQVEDVPTGGKEPRHFAIDPSGQFLLAENQLSDAIVEFRIDSTTGKLTPTGETLSVASPVCITFLSRQ
jgi:6-phosphogluconolactonase